MKLRLLLLAAVGLLLTLGPRPAAAELVWEGGKSVVRHVKSADREVRVTFRFRNSGERPVEILDIRPDCNCTVARLDQRRYAPGASGEIEVIFTVGQRVGENINAVQILTDDPEDASVILVFTVHVREPIQVAPRFLYWTRDEPRSSRSAKIELDADLGLRLREARSSSPFFTVQLLPKVPDRTFQLIVTPEHTGAKESATVTLEAVAPDGAVRTFPVLVRVY